MSEKNIKQMFETIAKIISEKEGVKITVKKITKKEKVA